MKRPEKFDPRFRELLDTLFKQVVDLRGGMKGEKVLRLASAVLISSSATTTPFHFDPEVNFFSQIEGEKIYHVFAPATLTETELETFYVRGVLDIAQVKLAGRAYRGHHVPPAGAPDDHLGPPVHQRVPHGARIVVSGVSEYMLRRIASLSSSDILKSWTLPSATEQIQIAEALQPTSGRCRACGAPFAPSVYRSRVLDSRSRFTHPSAVPPFWASVSCAI